VQYSYEHVPSLIARKMGGQNNDVVLCNIYQDDSDPRNNQSLDAAEIPKYTLHLQRHT